MHTIAVGGTGFSREEGIGNAINFAA